MCHNAQMQYPLPGDIDIFLSIFIPHPGLWTPPPKDIMVYIKLEKWGIHMKRVFSLFLCLLMLAGLLSGCAEAPESSGQSRIITDSLGRQVSIPDSVDSVVWQLRTLSKWQWDRTIFI